MVGPGYVVAGLLAISLVSPMSAVHQCLLVVLALVAARVVVGCIQ